MACFGHELMERRLGSPKGDGGAHHVGDRPEPTPFFGSADRDEPGGGAEHAEHLLGGVVADIVEHHVESGAADRDVVDRVVDHVVGADRSHHVDIAPAAYCGDLGAEGLGDLDGEGPDPAGGTVYQEVFAGLEIRMRPQSLQRGEAGDRCRGGVLERDADGLGHDPRHLHGDEGGAAAATAFSEHLVADGEIGDVGAEGDDPAGDIGAGHDALGPADAVLDPQYVGRAGEKVPVEGVERRRLHLDENLACAGGGHIELCLLDDLAGAVGAVDHRGHPGGERVLIVGGACRVVGHRRAGLRCRGVRHGGLVVRVGGFGRAYVVRILVIILRTLYAVKARSSETDHIGCPTPAPPERHSMSSASWPPESRWPMPMGSRR